jgi:uncharacterized protein
MENPTPPKRGFFGNIFLSPNENRLRAGWRIAVQTFLMAITLVCILIPISIIDSLLYGIDMYVDEMVWMALIAGIAITVSVILARRFIDRRSIASLGIAPSALGMRDLIVGWFMALFAMGILFVAMRALGWVEIRSAGIVAGSEIFVWFIIFLAVGWYEELLVRGYYFQNLKDGLGKGWAIALTSVLFGFMHITNPNASLIAALGITLAGLLFAYAILRTGSLWLAVGIHAGWNFSLGNVFGLPVSGIDSSSIIQSQLIGPELWTGGYFGPEAGLAVIPTLALLAVMIYGYTHPDLRPSNARPEHDSTTPSNPV